MATATANPTPLKTILSATRYPYGIGYVVDGKIVSIVGYATTLEEVYHRTNAWNQSLPDHAKGRYIMVEQKEIGEKTATSVNSYFVAV